MAEIEETVVSSKICIEKVGDQIIVSFLDSEGNAIESAKTISSVAEALSINLAESSVWVGLKS